MSSRDSILCGFLHRSAEQIAQFLVDQIPVGVEIRRQDMVGAGAIRFVTLSGVTGLKQQIAVFDRDPDMLARVAIAPFEDQAAAVLIETPLTIDEVAVEHMQNLAHLARLDHLRRLGRHLRRSLFCQVSGGNLQLAGRMLRLANHLRDHLALFIAQPVSLPQNRRSGRSLIIVRPIRISHYRHLLARIAIYNLTLLLYHARGRLTNSAPFPLEQAYETNDLDKCSDDRLYLNYIQCRNCACSQPVALLD